jgi:hypothetical protein
MDAAAVLRLDILVVGQAIAPDKVRVIRWELAMVALLHL